MAQLNFSVSATPPVNSFDPLPVGDYIAQITDSNTKPTKAGTGMVLHLTWTILDGQFANRKVFDRVNVANPNPVAEKIGREQLDKICYAIGVRGVVEDSNQLHGRPCKIKLKIRKDDEYGDSNEVKAYTAITNAAPPMPAASAPWQGAAAAPGAPAAPTAATPPWATKSAA